MVGIPAVATERSPEANWGSCREAGLAAATTGSRLVRVESRPLKVRVERRRVEGSSDSAVCSDSLWRAIAPVAVSVFAMRSLSWLERAASAFIATAPFTSSPSNAGSSRASSLVTALVLSRPGARYSSVRLASFPLPRSEVASPWMRLASPRRVGPLKESNSSSMLTSE